MYSITLPFNAKFRNIKMNELTSNNQEKLKNIIQYYDDFRKTNYVNNKAISIENQRRKEIQTNITLELQKIKDVKKTDKYMLLKTEKSKIYDQIFTYEDNTDDENTYYDEIDNLYNTIKTIEYKQLEIIKTNGINIKFLEDNDIKYII